MPRRIPKTVTVHDKMQKGYRYTLTEPEGKNFDPLFKPQLSPKEMLALGVFGGKYMTDCKKEFPVSWFTHAKLAHGKRDKNLNFFGANASQSLQEWRRKGWINEEHDPRGWFQWYCRYYMGRRLPEEDKRQINRWIKIRRHLAQIYHACERRDYTCHTRQRQAVLHWAYDARKI